MSTKNYLLGVPDEDDKQKAAPNNYADQSAMMYGQPVQQQPAVAQPQPQAHPVQQVPQTPAQQGNLLTNMVNVAKAQYDAVKQAAQNAPKNPAPQPSAPTFTEEQLQEMQGRPNVATGGSRPLESQWARQVLSPDGVTGSPITSAEEQVAKLDKNGIAAKGINDGKRTSSAAPSASANGTQPPMVTDLAEMWQWMKENDPRETKEQREAREKKERQKKMWGAISDGISALSNLYFSSKGAPIQYDPSKLMTTKAQERYDQLKKEREQNEQNWLNSYMRLKAEERLRERDKAYSDYRQGNLERLKEKDDELIELKRQYQELQKQKAETEKKYKEALANKANSQTAYTDDRRNNPEKYTSKGKSSGKGGGKSKGTSSRGRGRSRTASGGGSSPRSSSSTRGGGGKTKFTFS